MKKLFISQASDHKTYAEIMYERQKAIRWVKLLFHDDIEVVNSVFQNTPDLWVLGKNLELMSEADVVIFLSNWKENINCKIEHICAMEYGIESLEL